ncbi:SpoIID/LytB domain-containing protein [Pseudalkalibacillus berkeleyi]|uniref:SpoIID/LytB domain-containing protein n=1 Tax=Pseudalkalibacillus berkeleyi TaxID=1069813 RepID=A0ABS9H146_9BACL|nr:SpoIID/LytB domain-containing protein [Pseudalkalibacillus berkeleyi]MCF6137741.1 SpoIID/LytB domain-containing protein [Pseudalkalibacillus berkeleyi]
MFIRRIFIALLCIFVSAFSFSGFQSVEASEEQSIRIGVVPSAESITLGSDHSFSITDKETGEILAQGTNNSAEVSLMSSGSVDTSYRLQVAWSTNTAYIDDWLHRAEIGGYETYLEEHNGGYRLLIGKFPVEGSWSARVAFKNEMITNGLAASDAFWQIKTITTGTASLKVRFAGEERLTENPVQIHSTDGIIEIGGKKYRGIGEVGYNSSGSLAGINELPIEQYLYGVVPRELPPVPYGEIEAQKAQAVAARTYTLANLGKRSADGYDLLPTPSDQVYGGYDAEHPVSTQAVQETEGMVATHNGKLITAVYHSTSGGFTANNEDIWSSDSVAYLRGVPDAERGNSMENVPSLDVFKNHANAKSLRNSKNGDYESDWSKYHRWEYEWTNEEISEVLSEYFATEVGNVQEINVVNRSDSGRVLEIEFVTDNGTFYEYKDKIRWSLKYFNASGGKSVLLSTLFFIEPMKSKGEFTGFKAYGGGWGHGVGLSQTGAVGMATKGDSYETILKHYYQDIALEKKY